MVLETPQRRIRPGAWLALLLLTAVASADAAPRPPEIPADLDTSSSRRSEDGRFRVTLRSARPDPPINRIHSWSVSVRDDGGAPVDDAVVELTGGGMPSHGHGFPTEPRVTRRVGPGTWLVEGVKFNMTGWWQFEFTISSGDVTDRVAFDVVLRD